METKLRPGLPPPPERMRSLPLDERGYPVPWFVAWVDGKPEFRAADGEKMVRAVRERRCWLCGFPLGKYQVFVVGPMCVLNRVTSEPPSHRECAAYAVIACPFMTTPKEKRRTDRLPEGVQDPAGIHIERNPGANCMYVTFSYQLFDAGNGTLIRMGAPVELLWYCEGRAATRAEVLHSIDTGLPLLRALAIKQGLDTTRDQAELDEAYKQVLKWLPAELP
jgi:hypothetical protein